MLYLGVSEDREVSRCQHRYLRKVFSVTFGKLDYRRQTPNRAIEFEAMAGSATALVLVDVQNDFLPPTGSLAVAGGRDILPVIHQLLVDPSRYGLIVATQVCSRCMRAEMDFR